ncbi:hypothetical protein [Mycolicibacterium hippocampi]|nr:hypothetical protein [Mycolicibacterium hippocampi]
MSTRRPMTQHAPDAPDGHDVISPGVRLGAPLHPLHVGGLVDD